MKEKDFDLSGKVAVVTGAYSGNVGPIITEALLDYGAAVMGFDLPEHDITSEHDRRSLAYKIKPDILICNAAIDNPPSSKATFFGNIEKIMEVNLLGHARLIEMFLPSMIAKGKGTIILMGSIMGYIGADWRNYKDGFEKPVGYNLSKWSAKGLAKSLTVQYGHKGIRAVCPGFGPIDTGKFEEPFLSKILNSLPMRKLISPKAVRQTIIYACCCEELGGQDWLVDSGYTAW